MSLSRARRLLTTTPPPRSPALRGKVSSALTRR